MTLNFDLTFQYLWVPNLQCSPKVLLDSQTFKRKYLLRILETHTLGFSNSTFGIYPKEIKLAVYIKLFTTVWLLQWKIVNLKIPKWGLGYGNNILRNEKNNANIQKIRMLGRKTPLILFSIPLKLLHNLKWYTKVLRAS